MIIDKVVNVDDHYRDLLLRVIESGKRSNNRTGTDTIKIPYAFMQLPLLRGRTPILPLLTTKKMFLKGIVEELLWFLRGSTNAEELINKKVHIWDAWMLTEPQQKMRRLTRDERILLWANGSDGKTLEAAAKSDTSEVDLQQLATETIMYMAENRCAVIGQYLANKDSRDAARKNHMVSAEGDEALRLPSYTSVPSTVEVVETILDEANIPKVVPVENNLAYGDLGPIYGAKWRNFPASQYFYKLPQYDLLKYICNMESNQLQMLFDKSGIKEEAKKIIGTLWTAIQDRAMCSQSPEPKGFTDDYKSLLAMLPKRSASPKSSEEELASTLELDQLREALTEIGIDQISQAVTLLKENPNSRRIIVSAWDPSTVPLDTLSPQENVKQGLAALASCHTFFQFLTQTLTEDQRRELCLADFEAGRSAYQFVEEIKNTPVDELRTEDGRFYPAYELNCGVYCRSQDLFLGTPFNIASYALLTHMVAKVVNMVPGELTWIGADCHIYVNHMDSVIQQLDRTSFPSPELHLGKRPASIFDFTSDDIEVSDYRYHGPLKGAVAV